MCYFKYNPVRHGGEPFDHLGGFMKYKYLLAVLFCGVGIFLFLSSVVLALSQLWKNGTSDLYMLLFYGVLVLVGFLAGVILSILGVCLRDQHNDDTRKMLGQDAWRIKEQLRG